MIFLFCFCFLEEKKKRRKKTKKKHIMFNTWIWCERSVWLLSNEFQHILRRVFFAVSHYVRFAFIKEQNTFQHVRNVDATYIEYTWNVQMNEKQKNKTKKKKSKLWNWKYSRIMSKMWHSFDFMNIRNERNLNIYNSHFSSSDI